MRGQNGRQNARFGGSISGVQRLVKLRLPDAVVRRAAHPNGVRTSLSRVLGSHPQSGKIINWHLLKKACNSEIGVLSLLYGKSTCTL